MSIYQVAGMSYSDELWHYGIKGQKWGIRRFQNTDGSYTQEGLKRYRHIDSKVDLGYKPFQRINRVERNFVDRYKADVKGYMKNTKAASTTKRENKKERYQNEAKAFLSRSEVIKSMNTYYKTLFASDRKGLNKNYSAILRDNGYDAAAKYLDNELLRRKVSRDKQNDIWNR